MEADIFPEAGYGCLNSRSLVPTLTYSVYLDVPSPISLVYPFPPSSRQDLTNQRAKQVTEPPKQPSPIG